jgi:hypothetical protein
MPAATAWPLVLAVGIGFAGLGLATEPFLALIGLVILVVGVGGWIAQLLPGQGHLHEPLTGEQLPTVAAAAGRVEHLRPGRPGYRFRLPEQVHPVSAGVKGGAVGGLVMPIPALLYGVLSGHGIWFPINLLAGMVMPTVDDLALTQPERLEQFSLGMLLVAIFIHAVFSLSFGLMYGVVLPTLPPVPGGPLIWGGVLMPLLWTGLSYGLMGIVNPALAQHVEWPWFLVSQLIYGLAMAAVVYRSEKVPVAPAGPGPEPGTVPAAHERGGQP